MNSENTYTETTDGVTIEVTPVFLQEQSDADAHHFVWAYHIRIENNGAQTCQLLSRYWHITDLSGKVQKVRGEGVVGDQPVLNPGDTYEYTSGVPLETPSGFMNGTYTMTDNAGHHFDVIIPTFSLDSPHYLPSVH